MAVQRKYIAGPSLLGVPGPPPLWGTLLNTLQISDSTLYDGQVSVVLTCSGELGATWGGGVTTHLIISPTNDPYDGSASEQMSVTDWQDTTATFNATKGLLALNTTLYLFVINSENVHNSVGISVTFYDLSAAFIFSRNTTFVNDVVIQY